MRRRLPTRRKRLEEQFLRKTGGTESIAGIREQMQNTMEEGAGIYRTGSSLASASADKLSELKERFRDIAIADHSRTFNTEITAAIELQFMLDAGEAIIHSALKREESRGAHQRTDFPKRNDEQYLAHSLVHRNEDGSTRVELLPVDDHALAARREDLRKVGAVGGFVKSVA